MGASARKRKYEEGLDLSQLPPELLLEVLSHVPPRSLLRSCRRVCRGWRALVDGQALWLLILARDSSAEGRALLALVRSYMPAVPITLGRFCELRPIGRNLIRNPCGQVGVTRSRSWTWRRKVSGQNCWIVAELRFASLTGGEPDMTVAVSISLLSSFWMPTRWSWINSTLPLILLTNGTTMPAFRSPMCSPTSRRASALCFSNILARTRSSGQATMEPG